MIQTACTSLDFSTDLGGLKSHRESASLPAKPERSPGWKWHGSSYSKQQQHPAGLVSFAPLSSLCVTDGAFGGLASFDSPRPSHRERAARYCKTWARWRGLSQTSMGPRLISRGRSGFLKSKLPKSCAPLCERRGRLMASGIHTMTLHLCKAFLLQRLPHASGDLGFAIHHAARGRGSAITRQQKMVISYPGARSGGRAVIVPKLPRDEHRICRDLSGQQSRHQAGLNLQHAPVVNTISEQRVRN